MQVNRIVLEPGFKSRIESSHVILVKLVVFESAERGLGSFSPCDRSHLLRCLRLSQAEFNPLAADFKPDLVDGFVSDQLQVWRRWIGLIGWSRRDWWGSGSLHFEGLGRTWRSGDDWRRKWLDELGVLEDHLIEEKSRVVDGTKLETVEDRKDFFAVEFWKIEAWHFKILLFDLMKVNS